MADVVVELSDLRGWASQVGRGATDLGAAHEYATGNIADADFGRILELFTSEYAGLLPKMHAILEADGTGLGKEQAALLASAEAYATADRQGAQSFTELGGSGALTSSDDGEAAAFTDQTMPRSKLAVLNAGDITLPEVSFGAIWDTVCDLINSIAGIDPREYVTKWIAGDVSKASMQVAAWNCLAECVEGVDANLKAGSAAIARTWQSAAASAAGAQMTEWGTALTDQAAKMRSLSEFMKDMVDQAVKMAQVVVDIIKTVIDLLSAALTNAAIPFYGQWKLIDSVWDGVKMVNSARKVITVFWDVIKLVIDMVKLCVATFTAESLPPAPSAAPAGAGR
ncbi:hypothetical protein ACTG9Q_11375 [Actinokineospora sp. 24-640]